MKEAVVLKAALVAKGLVDLHFEGRRPESLCTSPSLAHILVQQPLNHLYNLGTDLLLA